MSPEERALIAWVHGVHPKKTSGELAKERRKLLEAIKAREPIGIPALEDVQHPDNLEVLLRLSTIKIEIDKIQEQLIDGVVNSKPLRFDSFAAVRKLGEANLALIEAASEIQHKV